MSNLHTFLISPEQLVDLDEPQDWLRDATPEEATEFRTNHSQLCKSDPSGRPYWTVTADLDKAPAELVDRIKNAVKVFRF